MGLSRVGVSVLGGGREVGGLACGLNLKCIINSTSQVFNLGFAVLCLCMFCVLFVSLLVCFCTSLFLCFVVVCLYV